MSRRSSDRLTTLAPALAGALAAIALPLHAQSHAELGHDSVTVQPGLRIAASSSGASVAVLDSADIAASGARTLSELLQARVAGMSVARRSGVAAEGSDVRVRGLASPLTAAPMLVIDGVPADAAQATGLGVGVSRLDDLTPADVERIEVLRGPAASAAYGVDAANGVIVVTTRRAREGPLRLAVRAGGGITELSTRFPANYSLTSGAPRADCNPIFAGANCTATTLYQNNPLERASPFRVGRSATAGADVSGDVAGNRLYAGASAEHVGGVLADDGDDHYRARADLTRSLPAHLTLDASAGWLRRESGAPRDVVEAGLLGSPYAEKAFGYDANGYRDFENTVAESRPMPATTRTTAALRLDWRPTGWLTVTALGGRDHDRTRSDASATTDVGNGSLTRRVDGEERVATSGNARVAAEARYALGAVNLSSVLAYDDSRYNVRQSDSSGASPVAGGSQVFWYQSITSWYRAHPRDASVRQHLGWRGLDVNGNLRWSATHGLSMPHGPRAARSIDASYQLPALPGVDAVRLRAAAGVTPLVSADGMPYFGAGYQATGGGYGYGAFYLTLHPQLAEREAGVDVRVNDAVRVELTAYRNQSREMPLGAIESYNGGLYVVRGDVRDRGVEATANVRLVDARRVRWTASLTGATLGNRVTAASLPLNTSSSRIVAGRPIAGLWVRPNGWTDLNHNGVVDVGERTMFVDPTYAGTSLPSLELGLRNTVVVGRDLSLGVLLDYRGGHYRVDDNEEMRCRYEICRGLEDPSASAAERKQAVDADAVGHGAARAEHGDYLRLREVVLDWSAPWLGRLFRDDRASVRLVGQNLATWSRFGGLDPEVGGPDREAPLFPGPLMENFQLPMPRTVRLELRLGADLTR